MILSPVSFFAFVSYSAASFVLGILLGAVYDIFRIRRVGQRLLAAPSGRRQRLGEGILIFLEDLLYSLFCAAATILVHFRFHHGIPRLYALAACAGGFLLYRRTVGRLVIASSEAILRFLKKAVLFLYVRIFLPPVRSVRHLFVVLASRRLLRKRRRFTGKKEASLLSAVLP